MVPETRRQAKCAGAAAAQVDAIVAVATQAGWIWTCLRTAACFHQTDEGA